MSDVFIRMDRLQAISLGLDYVGETCEEFDFICLDRMQKLARSGVSVVACDLETQGKTVFYRFPSILDEAAQ